MTEKLVITEKNEKRIMVSCSSKECENCHSSIFCSKKTNSFEVLNPEMLEVNIGDEVVIDLPENKTIFSIIFSLLFPLLMFLPGYFLAKFFTSNELYMVFLGLAFVLLGFLIVGIFFKIFKEKFTPNILKRSEKDIVSILKGEEI